MMIRMLSSPGIQQELKPYGEKLVQSDCDDSTLNPHPKQQSCNEYALMAKDSHKQKRTIRRHGPISKSRDAVHLFSPLHRLHEKEKSQNCLCWVGPCPTGLELFSHKHGAGRRHA